MAASEPEPFDNASGCDWTSGSIHLDAQARIDNYLPDQYDHTTTVSGHQLLRRFDENPRRSCSVSSRQGAVAISRGAEIVQVQVTDDDPPAPARSLCPIAERAAVAILAGATLH